MRIPAHNGGCEALDIDRHDSKMVTAGRDGLVALWNMENLTCDTTIIEEELLHGSCCMHGSGSMIAYGCSSDIKVCISDFMAKMLSRVRFAMSRGILPLKSTQVAEKSEPWLGPRRPNQVLRSHHEKEIVFLKICFCL